MTDEIVPTPGDSSVVATIRKELERASTSRKRRIGERFIVAALGSIPWIGGFIAGVIRQSRDVNEVGQFLRKRPVKRRGSPPTTIESAFEDSKQYVLTELGKQFIHYTMNETVARLAGEISQRPEGTCGIAKVSRINVLD